MTCTVQVKMLCEYELKYISGIDPTIVWMDLIGTILRFGTSESENYGLSKSVSAKLIRWANNPQSLLKEVFSSIKSAISGIVSEVTAKIEEIFNDAKAAVDKATEEEKADPPKEPDPLAAANEEKSASLKILDSISKILGDVSEGLIQKYRVKIIGIVNALAGLPSTPWHLTIGNPMRPIFCSGDMLTKSVSLKLGPQLAFNDLPSSITVEFTLENARALGMQEIMGKFNSGYLRSIDVQKTYYETSQITSGGKSYTEPIGILPGEASVPPDIGTASGTASGGSASNVGGTGGPTNTNNNLQNPLPSGNTQSTADGGVVPISGSASEAKSHVEGSGNASNTNPTISDANSTLPATGPTVTK